MNLVYLGRTNDTPTFKRTSLIDDWMDTFRLAVARKIITQKYLKKFSRVVQSEKSTKMK
ncbi:hypothetical protein RR47_GL001794 [Enterococcus columbae DSM 7374 = ATCC 51263]|nr:hypothetical protein RR47_GL001794 [Enterococcus columbae DSM 7374 = ATCC 51263]